jgi:hypothetical protein
MEYVTQAQAARNFKRLADQVNQSLQQQTETIVQLFEWLVDILNLVYPELGMFVKMFPDAAMRKFIIDLFRKSANDLIEPVFFCFNILNVKPKTPDEFMNLYMPLQIALILYEAWNKVTWRSVFMSPANRDPIPTEEMIRETNVHFAKYYEDFKKDIISKELLISEFIDIVWLWISSKFVQASPTYDVMKQRWEKFCAIVEVWEEQHKYKYRQSFFLYGGQVEGFPSPDDLLKEKQPHVEFLS